MNAVQAVSHVLDQSAFAKQNMNMADLFANRLVEIFAKGLGLIKVTKFSTEESTWSGTVIEKIEFTLPNGQTVACEIATPKAKA